MTEFNMESSLQILKIIDDTIVDGPGFRMSIYAAGCKHHCLECHNPESWSFQAGSTIPIQQLLKQALASFGDITFTGGDPLFQVEGFAHLAQMIKCFSNKSIWCYTGFTYEEIESSPTLKPILKHIDVLVDGQFNPTLKNHKLLFRGSKNQRIIDVQYSLQQGRPIVLDLNEIKSQKKSNISQPFLRTILHFDCYRQYLTNSI